MDFRKDINGLRAIAVLAVIIFHFNPEWLTGGFAGVDVFFVISGYLMTSIIYRGIEKDQLSLLKFYLARGRRIVPALLLPCTVLLLLGWFLLLPQEFLNLGKHVASSLGFVSNIVYWTEAGYFAAGAHEKWLLHTWSLSVEWQFYILYPIVLLIIAKLMGLKALRWAVVVGALVSFILSVYASVRWPEAAFFLLPTRAWEMMAGGLVFLFPVQLAPRRALLVELAGLACIIAAYLTLSESDVWPGYLALLPVAGAFLMLSANNERSVFTANPLAQWLGTVSYSLYLWHWPVVVLLALMGLLSNLTYQLLGIAASLILAQLSYTLVEQKMRARTAPNWSFFWIGNATLLCVLGMIVFFSGGVVTEYRAASVSDKAKFIAVYQKKYDNLSTAHWISKCNAMVKYQATGKLGTDPICTEKQGDGGVFLWGDSHAEALSYGLRHVLPRNVPFYQATSSGCRPSLRDDVKQKGVGKIACTFSNKFAISKIAELKPAIVILGQRENHELTDWSEMTAKLISLGVRQVVVIGPTPQWQPSLPLVIVNRHWNIKGDHIVDSALDKKSMQTNLRMSTANSDRSFTYISLIDRLCVGDSCQAKITPDDALLLVDYGHLSPEGSLYVVKNIIQPKLHID